MIVITDYSILRHDGFYFAVAKTRPICPDCGSFLSIRDSHKRLVKDSAGKTYAFKLRRFYCSSCNHLHMEIPDCIRPHKHYFAQTIATVQKGGNRLLCC